MRCAFFLVLAAAVAINALQESAYTDVSEVIITESLKRSEGRQYKLQAFGQEYELDLTPVDDVLPENLFVHVHTQNEDGTPDIEDWTHRTTGKQGLFVDKKHHASIFINDAREDGMRMTGLVTEGVYIEPEDNINIDIDEKRSHVTVTHKLYKLKKPIEQTTEDDFEIDPEALSDDIKEKRAVPEHIYVPVHVVVDYELYQKIGKPTSGVIEYIKVYYNAVNDLYSTISWPTVHISIQGITICTVASACQMVESARLGIDAVNSKTALDALSKWAYDSRSKTGEEYAAMMAMTGYDLCTAQSSGACRRSNAGLAFVATACSPFRFSKTSRTGIAEDNGNFDGVKTVAHEIGHILGMKHDGDGAALPGSPGARSCPWNANNIMGQTAYVLNQWIWSKCSVEQLRWLAVQSRARCLLKKPSNSPYPLVDKLPGKQIDLDNQCKMKYGPSSFVSCREPGINSGNDQLCLGLMCKVSNSRCQSSNAAAEGSYCGPQRYCIRGSCICDPTAPLPTAPPKDPNCQGDNPWVKISGKSCVDLLSASDGLKNCNSGLVKKYCCESVTKYCKATPISCDGKTAPTPKTTRPIDIFTTQPATARPTNNPNKNNSTDVDCGKGKKCVDTSNMRINGQSCSALLSSTKNKQTFCDHPTIRTHCCATRKQLCVGYHWITESCDSQCQDNPNMRVNGKRCVPFLQDTKSRENFCHVSVTKQHCCATRAKLCTSDPFGK